MDKSMLTTIDNPYNPFTNWDDWYTFDESKGYHTTSYLARIIAASNELSEEEESNAIELAIEEIVAMNIIGLYKKVTIDSFK